MRTLTEAGGDSSVRRAGADARVVVLMVVLGYAGVAASWILLSDHLLYALTRDSLDFAHASMIKGGLFVAVTALALYLLVSRLYGRSINALEREHAMLEQRAQALALLDAIIRKRQVSEMLQPNRRKFRKEHKGRNEGLATRGTKVSFGEWGLPAFAGMTARVLSQTTFIGVSSPA